MLNNPASMGRPSTGVGIKKIPSPEEEAASKVYKDDKGNLYLNTNGFRSGLLSAATGRRIGKFAASSILSGAVFPTHERATLVNAKSGKPVKKYTINTMRAVVQQNGVLRSRPQIDDWACDLDSR